MDNIQLTKIITVIAIGAVLGGLILVWDKTAPPTTAVISAGAASKTLAAKNTNNVQSEPNEGPQGGKLFTKDGFSVEVTIFEKGVPPQFRLYLYQNDEPLPPAAAKVAITLSRLGAPVQLFKFTPEADYLLSDQVVEEPHSFEVAIVAEHNGKTIRWGYSQVEARVEMPDEILKNIGVEIRTAGPAMSKPTLKLLGEIVFNPDSIVQVVPRLPGVVVAVNREPGQQVQKGEVLAVIESQVLADLRS